MKGYNVEIIYIGLIVIWLKWRKCVRNSVFVLYYIIYRGFDVVWYFVCECFFAIRFCY